MKRSLNLLFLLILFACNPGKKEIFSYHQFENNTWNRFDKVNFSIDITREGVYDVILEATHTQAFDRNPFTVNMVMNTPSGEERINEYSTPVKNSIGKFTGKCEDENCTIVIMLKHELHLTKGNLKIELENLIPYISTENLKGVGIRLVPLG